MTHVVVEKSLMVLLKMEPCIDTLLPVCSHTTFNATVVTFHFHNDDQTVVRGQPLESIALAVAVVVKTMVAMFSTKHGQMQTIAPQVTVHSHGMISEIEDLLKKMFST